MTAPTVELGTLEPGALFELAPGRAPQAKTRREPLLYELVEHDGRRCEVVRVVVGAQLELLTGAARELHTERWTPKTLVVLRMRLGT